MVDQRMSEHFPFLQKDPFRLEILKLFIRQICVSRIINDFSFDNQFCRGVVTISDGIVVWQNGRNQGLSVIKCVEKLHLFKNNCTFNHKGRVFQDRLVSSGWNFFQRRFFRFRWRLIQWRLFRWRFLLRRRLAWLSLHCFSHLYLWLSENLIDYKDSHN